VDNKTHFILGTNCYMLWHQGAILRGFIKKKDHKCNMYSGASRTCPLYVFDSDMKQKKICDAVVRMACRGRPW